jgi:hypothetical protein
LSDYKEEVKMAKFSVDAPVGVGLVVWNPTVDDFDLQYAGFSFTIKAGEKRHLEINCANYALTAMGPRGLTSLVYGDEARESQIGADAISRNKEFKTRQIVLYNQQNENRKHMNLGYLPPADHLKKYALELGLKLLEPYSVRDEERNAISQTKAVNEDLSARLSAQDKEMAELKAMLKQLMTKEEPKEPSELRVRKDGKWVKEGT